MNLTKSMSFISDDRFGLPCDAALLLNNLTRSKLDFD